MVRNPARYPLRLRRSLKEEVERIAERDGTSINQFVATAITEKVSARRTATSLPLRLGVTLYQASPTAMS